VKAWLATQDAVFRACHDSSVSLPAEMSNAPAWLNADRAYQEAAFALYQGRNAEAAARFSRIAADNHSPWRGSGPYLAARALIRQAVARRSG
jgi:hypothetical protein